MTLLALPYMGTKRGFAPAVAEVICAAKPGIVMDAFSGMCAIGQSVGTRRNVWSNDAQGFAAQVAGALFTSRHRLGLSDPQRNCLKAAFNRNAAALAQRFARRLASERACIASGRVGLIRGYLDRSEHVGSSGHLERERQTLSSSPQQFPYRLCAITFSDGYFGLQQAIDIDSARYAMDTLLASGEIDGDDFRWLMIALGHAAMRVATTTGHFAQFLTIGASNLETYISQRRRDVWTSWCDCQEGMRPVGTARWRKSNRAFNRESISLIGYLADERIRPAVIYADPPYTDDQYSRYYHVWETLVKYDYPMSSGEGRYRPARFQTPFSRVTEVKWAFGQLFKRTAALGADLVLSYPEDGLLKRIGCEMTDLLKDSFSSVSVAARLAHSHSTMGASKGKAKREVCELIYLASNP